MEGAPVTRLEVFVLSKESIVDSHRMLAGLSAY